MRHERRPLQPVDVLAFEADWLNRPQHDGRKDNAIRSAFGVSRVRYDQALIAAIASPEAVEGWPIVVRTIQARVQAHRRRASSR